MQNLTRRFCLYGMSASGAVGFPVRAAGSINRSHCLCNWIRSIW